VLSIRLAFRFKGLAARLGTALACAALALVVLAWPGAPRASNSPSAETPKPHVSLVGQLLIASPALTDPRFAHAVVLMVRHDRGGAFGLVINRVVSERPLSLVLEALGEKNSAATEVVRVFLGGPVQPQQAFVLHDAEYREAGTVDIAGRLALTASRDVFRALAAKSGPKKSLIAFGYAGWAAGQLEGELASGAWYTAPADVRIVFDEDRDRLWDLAMERRTRDL
jgi:putative transcriptional regulator